MRKLIALGAVVAGIALAGTSFGAGEDVYNRTCVACHGSEGAGTPLGPAFKGNEWLKNAPDDEVAVVIREGRLGDEKRYKAFVMDMPPQPLDSAEVKEVIEYIKGLAEKKQ